MPARIYRVVDLHVLIVGEGADRRAIIEAIGFTATPGWSDIRLHSLEKKLSPDGILDIEFVGEPPAKPVPQVVPKFPVTGCLVCEKDVERLVGVRIVARSNELSRLLGQTVQRGGLGVMPGPGGAGDGGPPIITFEEGETMPTLGEDNPTEAEEPPITFEDGEEMPTLGETDPTQAETGPTKWEDIPTSDEENPTAQEETPTGQETTPTFREWEATQWEDFPTLPAGEEGKHWITDNPPQPLPPSTIWWENPPQHPFPGPFAPDQPGSNRQQGRWVVRNGRWVFVRSGGGKKSPFGGRHR